MKAENLVIRISADEDWLRLVAYRATLQEIAESDEGEEWQVDPRAVLARRVLQHFGEEP